MKSTRLVPFLAALAASLFLASPATWAQTTAFSYQGSLADTGRPATGSYDLQFSLFNAASGGAQVGSTVTNLATGVTNGLFTVTLDFGATPYNGQALWLQTAVSPTGSNTFTVLSPLQPLTSTPYAVQALNATTVTGPVTLAQLPAAVLTNGAGNVTMAGTFTGNAGGLTNLNASQLTGTVSLAQLPSNVLTVAVGFNPQTNVYSSAGVYTVTVPAGATQMISRLWGAGGGGGFGTGGGGAFVENTQPVVPGQTFTVVVGQHGDADDNNAGGAGSGDAQGGSADDEGGYYSGQGGQASSLFYDTNGSYLMLAVAGGGAGGEYGWIGGAGGNPGETGVGPAGGSGGANGIGGGGSSYNGYTAGSGSNYASNANIVGIANLSLAGGNGGDGTSGGGGGGGGYGGGGGSSDFAGGGGGSYGQIIMGGNNNVAGNNGDPNYTGSAGNGGYWANGNDGLGVIIFPGPGSVASVPGTIVANGFVGDGFVGNGGGLTNLLAGNLVGTIQTSNLSGTISDSQLQSDVALLDQNPVFTTLLTVTNGLRLNNSPIYLRAGTDMNHGLAYAGTTITNFGTNMPDGPVLWGYTGGVLGTLVTGSALAALSWNSGGVTVNGSLSAGSFSGNGSHLTGTLTNPISTSGTISASLFSGNGGGLTGLNASSVTGTLTNPISTSGAINARLFVGSGSGLTNLNASSVTGTLTNPISTSGTISASLFSGNGSGLTNLITSSFTGMLTNPITTSGTVSAGLFSGNGSGLSNLNTANLSGGPIASSLLPSNVVTTISAASQTNVYSSAGTYTVTVPAGAVQMTAKLWGAGGGGSPAATGGGGAFVQQTLTVSAGQTFTVVVGQHGDYNDNNGGGSGSGDAAGGNTPVSGGSGQGGQGSSLFYFNGSSYITEAVAGGGGGASGEAGGAGGNPGQTGASGGGGGNNGGGGSGSIPGNNYVAGATNTGISSPSLANGNGAGTAGGTGTAGGGGGFGGGGGGNLSYGGGGGGGSYGTIIIGGNNSSPGNTGDPSYVASHGVGGALNGGGSDGLVAIVFTSGVATVSGVVSAARFTGDMITITNAGGGTDAVALYNNNTASAFGILNTNGNALAEMAVAVTGGQWSTSALSNDVVLRASLGGQQKLLLQAGSGVANIIISNTVTTVVGTFNNNSDRNAKKDFAPVSPSEILDRVASLPLSTWSYKSETGTRHVGPMAQDFYSAFNVGTDDRHIAPIDEGGVALAAIQGLNQKLNAENAENATLKAELEAMRAEIKELEENQKSAP